MAFNISQFASRLKTGGARPTLFEVKLFNPISGDSDALTPLFVRTANLPESLIGTIEVSYMGRKLKIPGDRTFNPWAVTVINDEDFLIRDRLERWSAGINSHQTNLRARKDITELKNNAQVTQYGKTGEILRVYEFVGLYPGSISAIDLDWDTTDTLETFQVEFQYDYWIVKSGTTQTQTLE
jgi:hypothetical protein